MVLNIFIMPFVGLVIQVIAEFCSGYTSVCKFNTSENPSKIEVNHNSFLFYVFLKIGCNLLFIRLTKVFLFYFFCTFRFCGFKFKKILHLQYEKIIFN